MLSARVLASTMLSALTCILTPQPTTPDGPSDAFGGRRGDGSSGSGAVLPPKCMQCCAGVAAALALLGASTMCVGSRNARGPTRRRDAESRPLLLLLLLTLAPPSLAFLIELPTSCYLLGALLLDGAAAHTNMVGIMPVVDAVNNEFTLSIVFGTYHSGAAPEGALALYSCPSTSTTAASSCTTLAYGEGGSAGSSTNAFGAIADVGNVV